LIFARSLEPKNRYVTTSIVNTAVVSVVMMAVCALLVLGLGIWLVGRPLDRLAEKARRVGGGDLGGPLDLTQRDEVGQLAREMNAMCERLGEVNAHAAAEGAARIKALEQLRHADRLATVGKLAAGIAHELGTPLNVISGRAQMILRGKVPGDKLTDYVGSIAEQSERMTRIIRQLLDFARRRERRNERTDLGALVASTTNLLDQLATKRGVRLTSTVEPVEVLADSGQLEQVITNLVVNAMAACSEGGTVQVSTGREVTAPEAAGVTPVEHAVVRVLDDGHGMDPETLDHVFEPFFTTKDVGQGAGLGLSVAHGIVEEHGGFIRVESTKGSGSTFTVYLPIAPS
jgi:signal transduction histidine kinase